MRFRQRLMIVPVLTLPLWGLAVFAVSGCSGEPAVPLTAADQTFTDDELAAMRKSVKTSGEFQELIRLKSKERAGSTIVKTKSEKGKTKTR